MIVVGLLVCGVFIIGRLILVFSSDKKKKVSRTIMKVEDATSEEIDNTEDLATARIKEADGESTYLEKTNAAVGKGLAEGYEAQKVALGAEGTVYVNVFKALADKGISIVPTTLVTGGNDAGSLINVLTAKFAKEIVQEKK